LLPGTLPRTISGQRFGDKRITEMAAKTRKKSVAKPRAAKSSTAKLKPKAQPKAMPKPKAAAKPKVQPKPKATPKAKVKAIVKSKPEAETKTLAKPKAKARIVDSPFKNFIPYEPKRGEAYMGSKQLDHFRDILLKWRQELMEEVDRTVHHMQDEAANFPDPADRATQEEEFSIELRTRDRERKLIKKIDQTIERIDQDDYGYCDTCGVEIGLRRLEARPTATQCVDCKTLDEIKERQLHG
jgi:DnaK suppressor protein